MADETKIDTQVAAQAPAKVAEAVAETVEKAIADNGKAVKATATAAGRQTKKAAPAPKPAKAAARKTRNTRRAKPARKPATPRIERTKIMTNDFTKLFAFDALP